jgi:hypothetical protein
MLAAPSGATERMPISAFGYRDLTELFGILRVDVLSNNRDGHIALVVNLRILDLERR